MKKPKIQHAGGDTATDQSNQNAGHITELLLNELKEEKDIESFLKRNEQSFYNKSIADHMESLLNKYGISKNEAILRADIERGYGYQILRGFRDARRDKYIRLALGIGLDLDDTQHMLMVLKHGVLYPKVMRDALLIFCINNKCDIVTVQSLLFDHHLDMLE
jgi:hypothetical protein